jgi:CheY-like chemotaxis protein
MAHLLVIDDDTDIRFILKTFFTGDGHTVDTAENGKVGMELAEHNHYDLIITDMLMPEMDGIEVIAAIKTKSPATRIIALTGGSAMLEKSLLLSTAQAMRADKVVAKPLDIKVLKAAVNEVLAS